MIIPFLSQPLRVCLRFLAVAVLAHGISHLEPLRGCLEIRRNPPNGSWEMVKARPTPEAASFLNPPNGSWGIVKVQPTPEAASFLNPPNGSWGMVNVRPTPEAASFLNPPNGSWGMVKVQPSSVGRMQGWTLTIPQLPLGGFAVSQPRCVGWTLTIHRLPSVGFSNPLSHLLFKDHKATLRISNFFNCRVLQYLFLRSLLCVKLGYDAPAAHHQNPISHSQ